jgi:surface polysaccharide O-acyltransferase-like enzyme
MQSSQIEPRVSETSPLENNNLEKIYAFDYLRAICCIIVVVAHTNVISLLPQNTDLHNMILYNGIALAVPIFFQTSLILFFLNREKKQNYFTNKRIPKLLQLYFFWGLFSHVFYLIYDNQAYLSYLRQLNLLNFLVFLLSGGYRNPFYFLSSLLILTSLSELLAIGTNKLKLSHKFIAYTGLILSCGIVLFLPLSALLFGQKFLLLTQAFDPLSFIPYVFSSFLISQYLSNNQEQKDGISFYTTLLILLTLYIACNLWEWKYISHTLPWDSGTINSVPVYSRISLVFGAWLIILVSFKIKSEANSIFKLLSDLSLGIYCLHTFIGNILIYLFFDKIIAHGNSYTTLANFLGILFLSLLLTKLFKQIPILQDFI